MEHAARHVFDWGSIAVIIGAFADALPKTAAFLAVVWWGVRIYYEVRKGERDLRTLRKRSAE